MRDECPFRGHDNGTGKRLGDWGDRTSAVDGHWLVAKVDVIEVVVVRPMMEGGQCSYES